MHPAAVKEFFDRDVANLTSALATRRGWTFHSLAFPMIDCSFQAAGRTPLRIQMMCNDWNEAPPSVTLHSLDGSLLTTALKNRTNIFHPSPHPTTQRFFVCMRGTLEYHIHPSHLTDSWEAIRSNYTLGDILTQIWHGWEQGEG